MPRPSGMDDTPSTTLGGNPAVKYQGKPADCIWYAWENFHYPPDATTNCSNTLWASLSEDADPAALEGFMYFAPPEDEFYDATYKEYFCAIGCFNLAAAGDPSPAPANPPAKSTPPPPSPPVMTPPPPSTLFRPPPPHLPQPPRSIDTPLTGITPPPSQVQAPGPVAQTAAGIAIRTSSGSTVFVFVAALFLSIGLTL